MKVDVLLLCIALGAAGCKRAAEELPPPSTNGPRRVDVKVSNLGYTPDRVPGRPGEQLKLVFYYDASAGECGREVILPEAASPRRVTLGPDKPVEVALTMPRQGELQFTCGMNMLRGTLVVK